MMFDVFMTGENPEETN